MTVFAGCEVFDRFGFDEGAVEIENHNDGDENMGKKSKDTYDGDGTASLADSLRALHADMVARGYPPSTTKVP